MMSMLFMLTIFIAVFCLAYGSFLFISRTDNTPKLPAVMQSPICFFIILGFLGCFASYFIVPTQNDALYPSSLWLVIGVFLSAFIGFLLLNRFSSNKAAIIVLLALCLINSLLLPSDFSIIGNLLPPVAERILLAICWSIFAVLYFNMNACDGVLSLESLSVCLGLFLIYIVGIQPELQGFYASVFIALILAFHIFSIYPAKFNLNATECRIIGFLLGWLGIMATIEGNGSCFLILIMYYIYEAVIAFIRRLSLKKHSPKLADNTFYNSLASVGIPPYSINSLIAKINMMLILLAGFQIYSPNAYTLVIISFFMIFWMADRATSANGNQNILLTSMLWSALHSKDKNNKGD